MDARGEGLEVRVRAGSGAAPPSAAAAVIGVEVRHEVGLGGIETRRLVEVERGLGVEGEGGLGRPPLERLVRTTRAGSVENSSRVFCRAAIAPSAGEP